MPEEFDNSGVTVVDTKTADEDSNETNDNDSSSNNSSDGADVILTDVVGEDGYRKTQDQLSEDLASGNTENLDPAPQSSQSAVEGSVENINEQSGLDREAPTQRERNRQTVIEDLSTTTESERQADVNLSGYQDQEGNQLTEREARNAIANGKLDSLEQGPGSRTSRSAILGSRRNRANILQERKEEKQRQKNARPVGEQILNNNDNLTEKGREFVKDKKDLRELPTTAYGVTLDKFRERGFRGGADYLLNQTSNTIGELAEGDIQGAIDAGSTKTVAGEFVGESILGQAAEADKTLIDAVQKDDKSGKVNILGQTLNFEGVNVVEEKGDPVQKFQDTLPETQVFGERLGQVGGDAGKSIVKESGLGAGLETIGNQANNTKNILSEETENKIEGVQSDLGEAAIRQPFKDSRKLGFINKTESEAGQELALLGSDFAVNQLENFASNAFNNPEQTAENIGEFIGKEAAEDTAGLFTLIGGAGARGIRDGPQKIIDETASGSAILATQAAKNPEEVGKEFAGELILGGIGSKGLLSSKTETLVDSESRIITEENNGATSSTAGQEEFIKTERERRKQDPRKQLEERVSLTPAPDSNQNNPTPQKKALELLGVNENDFSGAFGGSENPQKYLDSENPGTLKERLKQDLFDLESIKSKAPSTSDFNPEIRNKLDADIFQKIKERRRDSFDFLGGSENPERFAGENPEFSFFEEVKGTALRDSVVIGTRDAGPVDFQEEAQKQFDPITQQGFLPELPLNREREPRRRTGYAKDALLGKAKEKNQKTTKFLEQLNEDLPGKSRRGSLGAGRGQEVILKEPDSETDTDSLVDNSVDLNNRVQDDRLRQERSLFDRNSEDILIRNRDRFSSRDSSRPGFVSIPGMDQGQGSSQDQGQGSGLDEGIDEGLKEDQGADLGLTQENSTGVASKQLFTEDFRSDKIFQEESSESRRRRFDLDSETNSKGSGTDGLFGDEQDLGLRRSLAADLLEVEGSTTAEEAESTDAAQQGTSRFQNPFSLRAFEDSSVNSEDLF